MHLSTVMLTIIAILSAVSGVLMIFGAEKGRKVFASVFTILCFAAGLWAMAPYFPKESWPYLSISCVTVSAVCSLIYIIVANKSVAKNRRTRAAKGWRMLRNLSVVFALSQLLNFYILPKWFFAEGWTTLYYISWGLGFMILTLYIIAYYALILKYRLVNVRNGVLKLWTYVVCLSVAAAAYMLIFYVISKYLFHVEAGPDLLAVNLVMVIIVALLFPVALEAIRTINSLIRVQKVDMTFVLRKLNRLAAQNVKMGKLAEFLADYLHFKYIGIIIDGKLYETAKSGLKHGDIEKIMMVNMPEKGLWLKPEGEVRELFSEHEIKAAAELLNAKGRSFGRILIGQPLGKVDFEKRDLAELELVLNLVASIIDSEVRLKA